MLLAVRYWVGRLDFCMEAAGITALVVMPDRFDDGDEDAG